MPIILGPTGTRYGAKMTVEWTGINDVRANLIKLAERYKEEMGTVLKKEGDAIMDTSLKICPYDQDNPHNDGTLHLNETGLVTGPFILDKGVEIILSYDTPYAVLQHEVKEYHHDIPEQWKYLEFPINDRVPYLAQNLMHGVDLERMLKGSYIPVPTATRKMRQMEINANKIATAKVRRVKSKYGNLVGRYL